MKMFSSFFEPGDALRALLGGAFGNGDRLTTRPRAWFDALLPLIGQGATEGNAAATTTERKTQDLVYVRFALSLLAAWPFQLAVILPALILAVHFCLSSLVRIRFARVAHVRMWQGARRVRACCYWARCFGIDAAAVQWSRETCIHKWRNGAARAPPGIDSEHPMHRCWFESQSLVSSLRLGIQKQMCRSHALYGGEPTVAPRRLSHARRHYKLMTVVLSPQMYSTKCVITEEVQPSPRSIYENDDGRQQFRRDNDVMAALSEGAEHGTTRATAPSTTRRTVDFSEYAPAVFHNLRLLHGVGDIELAGSFWVNDLLEDNSPHNKTSANDENRSNDCSVPRDARTFSVSSLSSTSSSDDGPQKSQGKSAAVFIKSHDDRYLLKTVNDEEKEVLLKMLPAYYDYMERYQGETLLPWFLGLYTLHVNAGGSISRTSVVMMSNVFTPESATGSSAPKAAAATAVDEQYDLKGSTVNRTVGVDRYGEAGVTYKDLDWLEFGHRVHLTPRQRIAILDQLSKDSAFLEKIGIMDYSLLLGVRRHLSLPVCTETAAAAVAASRHSIIGMLKYYFRRVGPSDKIIDIAGEKRRPPLPEPPLHRSDSLTGGLRSAAEPATTCYHFGVIDVLQKWNTRKKAETTLKRVRHLSVKATPGFSCVDPKTYRARFLKFMKDNVFVS